MDGLEKHMSCDKQVTRDTGEDAAACVLRYSPEEIRVAWQIGRACKGEPDSKKEEGYRRKAPVIGTQPLGLGSAKLPLEEPHGNERMYVDERQAPVLRNDPGKSSESEYYGEGPRPVGMRTVARA